jgi:hypothetical protein
VDQFERLCFERQSNRRTENATVKRRHAMPLAKIHVVEGRYDQARIAKVSGAIQAALMNTLCVPPEDFYQLIFELPKNRFLHTSSFLGMHYTDDLIVLDVTFIHGRPKETRRRRRRPIAG